MLKHNLYFDDQVQSIEFTRNEGRQSVGVLLPGNYHFGTKAAERMTVVSGECEVRRDGVDVWIAYPRGTGFEVGPNSGFDIRCADCCAYLCEYI